MSEFVLPPRLHNQRGEIRRVGVELEFAGLTVEECGQLVRGIYGGEIENENRFVARVKNTRLGDFRVELDATYLKHEKHRALLDKLGVQPESQDSIEEKIESVVKTFVPAEIATPPIRIDQLGELDALQRALYAANAEGTRAALRYAFGLHFNPEAPDLDGRTLLDYLASFLILYDWIVAVSNIDFSRRVAPFIDPFPDDYRTMVIDPDYDPDRDQLIDDFLSFNPTRNRPLDMLPLFAAIAPSKIDALAKEPEQVKPRPTFHYRLPNCEIDNPEWSIAGEWSSWIEVERLAADREKLHAMRRSFFEYATGTVPSSSRQWAEEVWRWLDRAA